MDLIAAYNGNTGRTALMTVTTDWYLAADSHDKPQGGQQKINIEVGPVGEEANFKGIGGMGLVPAEADGRGRPARRADAQVEDARPRDGECWDGWQRININLVAPSRGAYEWCAMLMSDTWVGCNATARFRFSVAKGTGGNASRNFVRTAAAAADKGATLELDSDLESGGEDNDEDDGHEHESDDSDGYSEYSGSEEETDDEDEGADGPARAGGAEDDDDLVTEMD